jgi:hypothetical protein
VWIVASKSDVSLLVETINDIEFLSVVFFLWHNSCFIQVDG